jgi:SAM-dependent methyltransferase
MTAHDPAAYGDRIAEVYDDLHATRTEADHAAAVLADLARGGPVLELGIGTGRIALPLAERGVAVHGIDASEAMVARLRAKPGGAEIPVTLGDFADVAVDGSLSLIFVAFNTFFALLSQEEQVRCFRNVADHLAPGGVFVIEAFVPDLSRFARNQNLTTVRVDDESVLLDASLHDPVGQRLASQHIVITEGGTRLYPVQLRYAWPAELDLMAQLAGLRLRERWGGWQRGPFTAADGQHVSVYELDERAQ